MTTVQLRNSATRYGVVTRTLHWAIFLLLVFQFATGLSGSVEDEVHGMVGLAILLLAVVRIFWRWLTPLPDWAPTLSAGERHLSHWTERALYLGLLAKPITGLLYLGADGDELELPFFGELPALWSESDWGEDFFESAHAWAGYGLLLAIAVHVGLVLKHQLVNRDRFAQRMLPFTHQ